MLDARLGRPPRARRARGSTRPRRSATSCPRRRSSRGPRARAAATTALPAKPAFVPPQPIRARPAPQRLSYSQLSDYAQVRLPLLPAARARAARRHAAAAPEVEPEVAGDRPADARLDRPPRARGPRLRRPARRPTIRDRRRSTPTSEVEDIRRFVRAFADVPAVHARVADARKVTREAGFAFALEPDGSGPLVRGFVDVLAHEPTARTWSSTTRPTASPRTRPPPSTSPATTRRSGSSTRSPRCAPARRDRRGRLLPARAARRAGHARSTRAADAPELADAPRRARPRHHRARLSGHATRRTASCAATAPGAHALCSHPQSETLRPPPAPWPGAPARRSVSGRYFARRRSTTALSSAPNSSARFVTHSQTSRITAPANAP